MKPGVFRLLFLLWLWPILVWADDRLAVYIHDFDPPLQAQIDTALKARQQMGFGKILMLPSLQAYHGEKGASLAERLELLRASVGSDERFLVPKLEDVERFVKLHNGDEKKVWAALMDLYRPDRAPKDRAVMLIDRESPAFLKENPRATLEGIKKRFVYFQPRDPGTVVPKALHGNHAVKIPVPKEQFNARGFRAEPLYDDILLPNAAAAKILKDGLYNTKEMLGGFHSLPEHIKKQLQLEQLLNDRIENTRLFSSINQNTLPLKYYPESRPVFRLYHVDVPLEDLRVFSTGKVPEDLIYVEKEGKRYVRFFIHPKSKELFREALAKYEWWQQDYLATPTSSHRSLIAWDPKNPNKVFGVKTSLDAKIGETRRILSTSQIERAAASSALVNTFDKKAMEKEGIFWIDEPVGVELKSKQMGYAIRELVAPSVGAELIPPFSIYSAPPDGHPMVIGMVKKSGLGAKEFAEKFVIGPMTRQFMFLSMTEGFIGEPHEQNLLMEIKNGLPTGRYYYRDLAGFHINADLRAAAGKNMSFLPPGIAQESLKAERARPVENAITYLRQSNFYAMQKALQKEYPEITQKWVDEAFEKHFAVALERHTKRNVAGRFEWRRIVKAVAGRKCGPVFRALSP